jgi:hypothetical protein
MYCVLSRISTLPSAGNSCPCAGRDMTGCRAECHCNRRWDDALCAPAALGSFPTPKTVQRNPNWRVCQTVRSWRRGAGRPKGAITLPHTSQTGCRPHPGRLAMTKRAMRNCFRSAGVFGSAGRGAQPVQTPSATGVDDPDNCGCKVLRAPSSPCRCCRVAQYPPSPPTLAVTLQ